MDNSVIIVLVTKSSCIDTIISQIIERHTETESDRQSQNSCKIREADDTGDERKEITYTSNRNKCDPARKLHLNAVPEFRESDITPYKQDQGNADKCLHGRFWELRQLFFKIVRKCNRHHDRTESRKERQESVCILTVHNENRCVS